MKKILIMSAIMVMICSVSFSEETKEKKPVNRTYNGLLLKVDFIDTKGLNDYLKGLSSDFPEMSGIMSAGNLVSHMIYGNLIVDIESGLWYADNTAETSKYKANLTAQYSSLNFGYIVLSGNGFSLYPLLGYVNGISHLNIIKKENTEFDKLAVSPSLSGIKLKKSISAINTGVGIDCDIFGALMYTIRGGYVFVVGESNWNSEDIPVSGGPKMSLGGPYIQMFIGF